MLDDIQLRRYKYIHLLPQMAFYMCFNQATVRQVAHRFGVPKSVVWSYMTQLLPESDPDTYHEVRRILNINKALRTERGGLATQRKWRELKNNTRLHKITEG